eukprot:TRINITY_DN1706_c0_g1_i2.p1 TRINITY_DN1706_c0_g1~~TRINITY_DN1706_c0_g1_i2.p1  ORF type:complete len:312 (+),score=58.62 TRINITY_DN1706_c0_g1_i2:110-1045(+)
MYGENYPNHNPQGVPQYIPNTNLNQQYTPNYAQKPYGSGFPTCEIEQPIHEKSNQYTAPMVNQSESYPVVFDNIQADTDAEYVVRSSPRNKSCNNNSVGLNSFNGYENFGNNCSIYPLEAVVNDYNRIEASNAGIFSKNIDPVEAPRKKTSLKKKHSKLKERKKSKSPESSDSDIGIEKYEQDRAEFGDIAVELFNTLKDEEHSYDEIVEVFKEKYPKFADKFTPGFCSKLRCGRIMSKLTSFRREKGPRRLKRVQRVSARKKWGKMSYPLLMEMYEFEQNNPKVTKKEIERMFDIHRSTYWRWKNKFNLC